MKEKEFFLDQKNNTSETIEYDQSSKDFERLFWKDKDTKFPLTSKSVIKLLTKLRKTDTIEKGKIDFLKYLIDEKKLVVVGVGNFFNLQVFVF